MIGNMTCMLLEVVEFISSIVFVWLLTGVTFVTSMGRHKIELLSGAVGTRSPRESHVADLINNILEVKIVGGNQLRLSAAFLAGRLHAFPFSINIFFSKASLLDFHMSILLHCTTSTATGGTKCHQAYSYY